MTNAIKAKSVTEQHNNGPMAVGQMRTINDPKTGRVWNLKRTNRPYAYDIADAYNEQLPFSSNLIWIVIGVPGNEQVKLVDRKGVQDAS